MSQEKKELVENKINFCDGEGVVWDGDFVWNKNLEIAHLGKKHAIKYKGNQSLSFRLLIYSDDDLLGAGVYGCVYAAKAFTLNYELKQINYKKEKVVKVTSLAMNQENEFLLGRKIKHLGIKTPILEDGAERGRSYLLMNKMPGESLSRLIDNGSISRLTLRKKLDLTYKLLLVLREQVTGCDLIHCDIKPDNILIRLEPELRVNIIDYGFVKEIGAQENKICGTPNYVAPEVLNSFPYTPACDVYSMAKTIIYLWIEDKSLYNKPSQLTRQDIEGFAQEVLPYLKNIPFGLVALLRSMLHLDPVTRIDINHAIAEFERQFPTTKEIIDGILGYLEQFEATAEHIKEQSTEEAAAISSWVVQVRSLLKVEKDTSFVKDKLFALVQNATITSCAQRHLQLGVLLKNIVIKSCWLGLECNDISSSRHYMHKGFSYRSEGQFYQALHCFFQTQRFIEPDKTVFHFIAQTLMDLKWYDQAIIYHSAVLALDSYSISAYYGRGTSYLYTGQPQKATKDFYAVINGAPPNHEIHYLMSKALYYAGEDFYAAIHYYINAINLGYEPCELDFEWFFTVVKKLSTEKQQTILGQCFNLTTKLGSIYEKKEEQRELIRSYLNGLQSFLQGKNFLFFKESEGRGGNTPSDSQCVEHSTRFEFENEADGFDSCSAALNHFL